MLTKLIDTYSTTPLITMGWVWHQGYVVRFDHITVGTFTDRYQAAKAGRRLANGCLVIDHDANGQAMFTGHSLDYMRSHCARELGIIQAAWWKRQCVNKQAVANADFNVLSFA